MQTVIPGILKAGDEIAVIAISQGLEILHENLITKAVQTLEGRGLRVTLPPGHREKSTRTQQGIREKVATLHAALASPSVRGILIGLGGVSALEMLPYIDFDLVRKNPKPICGFSDATIILNAIYAQTGVITFYGPMLFSFAANTDICYTWEFFQNVLFSTAAFEIRPAIKWGNYDELNGSRKNQGFHVLRAGNATGVLVGGHVPSFNLLQGTPYLPSLNNAILFVEICERYRKDSAGKLMQYLNSLLLQKGADELQGLIVGRFYHQEGVLENELYEMLLSHPLLQHIPIITNVDIGHTTPMVTLPIGGRVSISQHTIAVEER
ncbi:muramoyltetrapeptide carboxypeptidase LdcA involved in peptidoglycan recycling [Chitinophaga polysaccharea]|uniref:Muramoyltetrapeptide carboxypeptidase LdcA involved in peptidoglycan recycling n=1 Tax=Chitinophaga polysaccharea TaxID=1293035 RepID=A0A561PXP0_9BACT|nr:S66 peptidase family protein [Chitinophaga polysaccharea]TWF42869.1 muramoyltetrapeptide carboxypeptidase LdcA involved in peptidoglycan recycling [Chitinophaga polysaccharea]